MNNTLYNTLYTFSTIYYQMKMHIKIIPITAWVQNGLILAPFLFVLYMNDLLLSLSVDKSNKYFFLVIKLQILKTLIYIVLNQHLIPFV